MLEATQLICGEVDEMELEILSKLPLNSFEDLNKIEADLKTEHFESSMLAFVLKQKGIDGSLDEVLTQLISDSLIDHYNWDGRCGKQQLKQFKLFNKVLFDAFSFFGRKAFEKQIRKSIELSHNRYKHKKCYAGRNAREWHVQPEEAVPVQSKQEIVFNYTFAKDHVYEDVQMQSFNASVQPGTSMPVQSKQQISCKNHIAKEFAFEDVEIHSSNTPVQREETVPVQSKQEIVFKNPVAKECVYKDIQMQILNAHVHLGTSMPVKSKQQLSCKNPNAKEFPYEDIGMQRLIGSVQPKKADALLPQVEPEIECAKPTQAKRSGRFRQPSKKFDI